MEEEVLEEKGIKQKDFIAQIQTMGCDMNSTSYSKLEGQVRSATDKEIYLKIKPNNMKLVLFPHTLCHGVLPFTEDERNIIRGDLIFKVN